MYLLTHCKGTCARIWSCGMGRRAGRQGGRRAGGQEGRGVGGQEGRRAGGQEGRG